MRTWPSGRDRAPAGHAEGAVEHRQVVGVEAGGALDGAGDVHVGQDRRALLPVVAERRQRPLDVGVHELHVAAADQRLVADEPDRRLDAGGLGVHHEADRPGRRDHADLGVAVARRADAALGLAERDGVVERGGRGRAHLGRSWRRRRATGRSRAASRCIRTTRSCASLSAA